MTAACERREADRTASTVSTPPVTLTRLAPVSSGTRLDLENQLFGDFNHSRSGGDIVVEVTPAPANLGPMRDKFVISAAAGEPLAFVENSWGGWKDLADAGTIAELTSYFKREKQDPLNIFIPAFVKEYSDDEGKRWALPITMSVDGLAYNMDLFDQAGLRYPPTNPEDKSWTMETFLEYGQKLTKAPDQVGFGDRISGGDFFGMTEGTHFGQGPWDDAKKQSLFDSAGMRKGMQWWLDLVVKHHVQPTADEATALRAGASTTLFQTGKVGMQVWYTQVDRLPFRWGLAAMPYSGGAGSKNISGRAFCHALHMGQVKERDAVWEVFKWLMKPENGGRYVVLAGHATSPIVKGGSDIAQKAYKDRTGVDVGAWVSMAQQVMPEAWGMFKYPTFAQVRMQLDPQYAAMRAGQRSVDAYATQAASIINAQLVPKR